MSRVVSLTPTRVEADSRTLKTAASLARMGHESIVVEALRSEHPPTEAGFALLTIGAAGAELADAAGPGPSLSPQLVERVARALGRVAGPLYFLASSALFNVRTARRMPAADLYWLHGYDQAPAVWLRRGRYVYDAHDFYPSLPLDGRPLTRGERATHRVREWIERRCVRRAAARVTTSAAMARLYEQRMGAPFEVVVNAADGRVAQPSQDDVRAAAGLPADAYVLAMVGNLKPGFTPPTQLPEGVDVVLVGAGYEALELPDRVHRAGPVPADRVTSFLRSADASALFYVPVNENSQVQIVNGVFHAVAAGLPLLYPRDMAAIRELCDSNGLGVAFDPGDTADVARAIGELRAGEGALREAVAAARPRLEWASQEETLAALVSAAAR